MIEARNLSKRYEDNVLALDALNLRVQPGEIYCLLGANGAGKTTTINLFLNFIEPTAGQAFLNDIDVEKNPLEAKKHVAYVSENVMLYGNFTARQNLDFFAKLAGGGLTLLVPLITAFLIALLSAQFFGANLLSLGLLLLATAIFILGGFVAFSHYDVR